MKTLIEQYCKEKEIQAISVCIHEHGKPVFTYTSGLKQRGQTEVVNEHTRFTIGSISKLFVTVALMQFIDQNKIHLDDYVYSYLPNFKMKDPRYKKITVRMLLNHSSGLPSTSFRGKYTNHHYPRYIEDMLKMYQDLPLKSDPGKYSVYCNDGFVLAQHLVETLSHLSFRDYCLNYITRPLGMNDTEFPNAILEETDYAHAPNEYDKDFSQEYVNGIGSGGVYSTSSDLCLFLDALNNGTLLSQNSWNEMKSNQYRNPIQSLKLNANGFGLGFDHISLPYFETMGYQAMAKGGATFGYMSYAYFIPQKELSVAVLSSSKESGVTVLAKELGKLYLQAKEKPLCLSIPKQSVNIEGVYGANNRIYQVKIVENTLSLSYYQFGELMKPYYLKKEQSEYCYEGNLFGFSCPRLGFVDENEETYMYLTYLDGKAEVRSVIGQKIKPGVGKKMSIPGKYYLKINEYIDQRTFYTQDLQVLAPIQLESLDCILVPFPLKIIDEHKAVPFIELPGNYSREMCELIVEKDGILKLGPYRYRDSQSISKLPNTLTLMNTDTQWYHFKKGKVILKPNHVRVIGLQIKDNEAKVAYDSLYCTQMNDEIDYIGFMGKAGDFIECQ